MSTIKSLVIRHPVPVYFAMTFAISWGAALAAIGGSGGMRGTTPGSDPRFAYALIGMLAGPSLTGVPPDRARARTQGASRISIACTSGAWVSSGMPWRS
jgi:hypothetical protein